MKTVVISQPTYLPWVGYFYLMKEADVYVFLDDVQFVRRSWQCRNRIKSPTKWTWLTVPTCHNGLQMIKDVEIDNSKPWAQQHWNTLRTCYGKAPYFHVYSLFFESVYEKRWTLLVELNIYIIKYLAAQLGLSPIFLRSSELEVDGKRTKLLLNICKICNADRYLSSVGAKEYMMEDGAKERFKSENIAVEFIEYTSPSYPQLFGEFIPNLSFVDCLFNCGPESSKCAFNEKLASFKS